MKVKLFENSRIDRINKDIAEFQETENVNIVDVKLASNQSNYKPSYSKYVIALLYEHTMWNKVVYWITYHIAYTVYRLYRILKVK